MRTDRAPRPASGARPTDPTGLLVFRNGSIGNTLAAFPALHALRGCFPHARLSVVVDPIGGELLARVGWIDDLLVYDKRGADRGPIGALRFARRLRALRPSHAILFKRFLRNGLLARLSGARVRVGFSTEGRAPFLNRTIPYREGVPVARLNLELVQLLGVEPGPLVIPLPLGAEDDAAARSFLDSERLAPRGFVTAHYGGVSTDPGFLSPEAFAAIVRRVLRPGEAAVLVGHGAREEAAAAIVRGHLADARPALGRPLLETAALIGRARLHVGMNSGPAHLAAATGTPALVVFRPGPGRAAEIAKWRPPTPRARALEPPESTSGDDWHRFLDTVERAAGDLEP